MAKSDFHFFWSGPFSQWAMRPVTINGQTFSCNEQYMMAEKARLFGDVIALAEIMRARDPAVQKAWGRKVKGFDVGKWSEVCRKVVYDASYAKFTQHADLKKMLLETGDKVIVEASPEDPIWGIGLRASDPRAWERETWQGTNWLGEAIMQARDAIRQEEPGDSGFY